MALSKSSSDPREHVNISKDSIEWCAICRGGVKLKQKITIKQESMFMSITGCTILPNGELLIADYGGKPQLMQYHQDGTYVRDVQVSSEPYDVTVLDSNRVAVSYGISKNIEIVNMQNTSVETKVDLSNNTWGLSYDGSKLFVVVRDCGIAVVELSGQILTTLNIDVYSVCYVATTTDRIYYSDYRSHTVTCCDMAGEQIWEFRNDSLQHPFGLSVDNNQNVFVAGYGYQNITNVTIISRDGTTSKILLTKSDGLYKPQAIAFSKNTGHLLVCNEDDTKAGLYNTTW